MPLSRAIYYGSAASAAQVGEGARVVLRAAQTLANLGLSGCLIKCGAVFLHCLEGRRRDINTILRLAMVDLDLRTVQLVAFAETSRRWFPEPGQQLISQAELSAASAYLMKDGRFDPAHWVQASFEALFQQAATQGVLA
jgi:hypothetical protein